MLKNNRTPVFTVHLDRLDHNLHVLCRHAGVTPDRVIAVVKDNGYGIGAQAMAESLEAQGVSHFAVAAFDEALFLREKGIGGSIIHLGLSDAGQFESAAKNHVSLSIIDPFQFHSFADDQRISDIHLLVDTGMHRNGIRCEEILSGHFDSSLDQLRGRITGLYTHYHSSDQVDQSSVLEQHHRFEQVRNYLAERDIVPTKIHCSNSGAVTYGSVPSGEMVRFGIAFHGIGRNVCPDLREVSEIHSEVTAVRKIYAGEGISYNHLYHAEKDGNVVTVPIGYGDGYSRAFTGKSWVIIGGVKYPVKARVTMDYVLADVGDAEVKIGDSAVLLGESGGESISVCELAEAVGTIPYEILCTCGAGMDHRYLRGGETVRYHNRRLF